MKKAIISLLAIFLLIILSCVNYFDKTDNKGVDSSSSVATESSKSNTLDSLQGTWYLKSDKKGELKIIKDSAFNIYADEIVDKAEIFFNNECGEDINNLNKKAGRFLILHSDVFMCYQIEKMTANELILFYNSNRLEYIKK